MLSYWEWLQGVDIAVQAVVHVYENDYGYPIYDEEAAIAEEERSRFEHLLGNLRAVLSAGESVNQPGSLPLSLTVELLRDFSLRCLQSFNALVSYQADFAPLTEEEVTARDQMQNELTNVYLRTHWELLGEAEGEISLDQEEDVEE